VNGLYIKFAHLFFHSQGDRLVYTTLDQESTRPVHTFIHRYPNRVHSRTVVAPPSSVVRCVWEVFVWGFGVLFLSCVRVSVSGVLFSIGVCVCDLSIFLQGDRLVHTTLDKESTRAVYRLVSGIARPPLAAANDGCVAYTFPLYIHTELILYICRYVYIYFF